MSNINVNINQSSVQTHITMLQGIINRVSNNSANCKNWTITIVVALFVMLEDNTTQIEEPLIYFMPISLFYILDCYYLGIERLCRESQKSFIHKVTTGEYYNILFTIPELSSLCKKISKTFFAMFSISTWPFYISISFFILILAGIIKI